MENFNFEISNSGAIEFVFLSIVLFLIILIFRYFLQILPIRRKIKVILKRFLPATEFVIWAIFFVWTASSLFKDNLIYSAILLLLIILSMIVISRTIAKDVIAGIVLKTENSFSIGDILQHQEFIGKITKSGYRYIEIETDKGVLIRIPFSTVSENPIVKINPSEIIKKNQTIKVTIPKYDSVSVVSDELKTLIMNYPLVSVTKVPTITVKSETENEFLFDITISTLDSKYLPVIKNYIKTKLDDKS